MCALFPCCSLFALVQMTHHITKHIAYTIPMVRVNFISVARSHKSWARAASFGWSDLGTWASAYDNLEKDYLENAVAGNNVIVIDATKNMVHTDNNKLVLLQGLDEVMQTLQRDHEIRAFQEADRTARPWIHFARKSA